LLGNAFEGELQFGDLYGLRPASPTLGHSDHCDCSDMSCGGLVATGRAPVFALPTLSSLSFHCYGLFVRATNESLHYATCLLRSMLPFIVPLCRIRPLGVLHQPCSLLWSIITVLANLSNSVNDASQIASSLGCADFIGSWLVPCS
jgi:hypothetical protein